MLALAPPFAAGAATIPTVQATALDDHVVTLPRDLKAPATVLILGFGRHSQEATTAWERPVRTQLAQPGQIAFYDMAMLAEVPGFIRPMVLRSVRHAVPDVLKPNFLPLTADEDAWKRVAGYDANSPEAAYVMLVDRQGVIRWSTHKAYSSAGWQQLTAAAHDLAASPAR